MSKYPIFMDWLAKQSPEVWHEVVLQWGEWDGDNEPIAWIVDQSCDRATAIEIFERCEPDVWMDFPNRDAVEAEGLRSGLWAFDISARIIKGWQMGQYKRMGFEHSGLSQMYAKLEAKLDPSELPWRIPLDMYLPSTGNKGVRAGLRERMEKELLALGLNKRTGGGLLVR